MFRVLIAVSLFQISLCVPLDNDLILPDDVEIIPSELHGHHSPKTLEKIAIDTGKSIQNIIHDEGETATTQTINHKDVDVGTIEEPIEGKKEAMEDKEPIGYKDAPIEPEEEPIEHNEKPIEHEEEPLNNKEELLEPKESTLLCSEEAKGKEKTEKSKHERSETAGLKPDEEVVLLNKTIRLNSTTLADGKFTVVLDFEVNGKDQIAMKDANIIEDEKPADDKSVNKSDDTEHFGCPIHAKAKVNVAALYGCGGIQHKCVKQESTDDEHIADNEENDDSTVYFNGPIEAHGKVTIGAHYGCGGIQHKCVKQESTDDEHIADNEENEDSTVYFNGPIEAHGKVSIGAHYGCGGINHNCFEQRSSTDRDLADNESNEEGDDDYVHVSGPVHAYGKVSIGAHYGCGGTSCSPYPFIYAQHFTHPPSYFTNYYEYPETFDDEYHGDDHHQFEFVKGPSGTYTLHNHRDDSQEDLPISRNTANTDSGEDDDHRCVVNGRVPAYGSVKIAAKY